MSVVTTWIDHAATVDKTVISLGKYEATRDGAVTWVWSDGRKMMGISMSGNARQRRKKYRMVCGWFTPCD